MLRREKRFRVIDGAAAGAVAGVAEGATGSAEGRADTKRRRTSASSSGVIAPSALTSAKREYAVAPVAGGDREVARGDGAVIRDRRSDRTVAGQHAGGRDRDAAGRREGEPALQPQRRDA